MVLVALYSRAHMSALITDKCAISMVMESDPMLSRLGEEAAPAVRGTSTEPPGPLESDASSFKQAMKLMSHDGMDALWNQNLL